MNLGISTLFAAHFLWIAFVLHKFVSAQNVVTTDPFYPEPLGTVTTPNRDSTQWRSFHDGAKRSGLLLAGRSEFVWVVDIRIDNVDQELWAIGNLITHIKVLTTCRAATSLKKHSTAIDDIRIYFATQYLWENHVIPAGSGDKYDVLGVAGKRQVTEMHMRCEQPTLKWDTAILELQREIIPNLPSLGYLYVSANPETEEMKDLAVDPQYLCYVASIGRKYFNWGSEKTVDHKVKFRVYPVDWQSCHSSLSLMCGDENDDWCKNENYQTDDAKDLMCFGSRAKVGSVCDHDRGAPLVCNNEIAGLVTRGVDFEHCNSLLHVPFFVLKRKNFAEYFGIFRTSERSRPMSKSGRLDVRVFFVNSMLLIHLLQYIYLML